MGNGTTETVTKQHTGMKQRLLFGNCSSAKNVLARLSKDEPVSMGSMEKICNHFNCNIGDVMEFIPDDTAYAFEDYKNKVTRYINENGDTLVIYKLNHNIPLAIGDYQELERVLTSELGSKEDYEREYGDTPFGLLIRRIVKLDHDAAMEAFSSFSNDQSLNQRQIAFVHKIINHIEQNGYMESVTLLTKPPFDKPLGFTKLFDKKTQAQLMEAINAVKENAIRIA